jgi:hypothetical protein
VPGR